ncbi:MAG TPA: hypothetical protein DDW79_05005, partial [Anaerolineae bacterium]|nr:hypothetical protein [Anaerolineae bacterium]
SKIPPFVTSLLIFLDFLNTLCYLFIPLPFGGVFVSYNLIFLLKNKIKQWNKHANCQRSIQGDYGKSLPRDFSF